MSINRRIARLEEETKNMEIKEPTGDTIIIKPTDDEMERFVKGYLQFPFDENDNVQWDFSLLSDEMLDKLTEYYESI